MLRISFIVELSEILCMQYLNFYQMDTLPEEKALFYLNANVQCLQKINAITLSCIRFTTGDVSLSHLNCLCYCSSLSQRKVESFGRSKKKCTSRKRLLSQICALDTLSLFIQHPSSTVAAAN